MSGGGRLTSHLDARIHRVIYGVLSPAEIADELRATATVDRAHLIMLAESGIVDHEPATGLLRCIAELTAVDFAPLVDRPLPRGLYLMYEAYLAERLGPDVGGVLHTGRSRNDLKATITAMRLRDQVLDLVGQAGRLQAALLSRARVYRDVLMPVHTHFQAAMPITYGYYLIGIATAVSRDIRALRHAAEGLDTCPLGAGAVAGTDLPIDTNRTAALLGFATGPRHALDAVAARDAVLRVLAAAAGLAVTLSRLAADLQSWSTVEYGFLHFPDRLVGGSSAMPQKRNVFPLEHLRAKAGRAIGAWTAAAGTMKATPFTNSIEVGTEAVADAWPGIEAVLDALLLAQSMVLGARPDPERMRDRAENGFTTATWLANRLVRGGVPFRQAHSLVGDAVRRAIEAGSYDVRPFGPSGWLDRVDVAGAGLAEVVQQQRYGGGPGDFDGAAAGPVAEWRGHTDWHTRYRHRLERAARELAAAAAAFTDPAPRGADTHA
ncbi:argininosuccinate lyase [Pilimelia terevasa]|uniref:Argininosuccinate lyase n=1 Tax=Pilimelia terevasa TaxID=53372 RepID=A0A8J3BHM3_9ACTN|nr:argininosuccinate lyase [Pilimelia terevasa]GGK22724.1 argininosuccinate lyase [Pilimelia terevasa]